MRKVNTMEGYLRRVAEAAYPHVMDSFNTGMLENGLDPEAFDTSEVDLDLYLYVYGDGNWLISDPSSLQDHRNIVATASVASYDSAESLGEALEIGRS